MLVRAYSCTEGRANYALPAQEKANVSAGTRGCCSTWHLQRTQQGCGNTGRGPKSGGGWNGQPHTSGLPYAPCATPTTSFQLQSTIAHYIHALVPERRVLKKWVTCKRMYCFGERTLERETHCSFPCLTGAGTSPPAGL